METARDLGSFRVIPLWIAFGLAVIVMTGWLQYDLSFSALQVSWLRVLLSGTGVGIWFWTTVRFTNPMGRRAPAFNASLFTFFWLAASALPWLAFGPSAVKAPNWPVVLGFAAVLGLTGFALGRSYSRKNGGTSSA